MLNNVFPLLKRKHMTPAIDALKNVLPLHTIMQDYHLPYPNVQL